MPEHEMSVAFGRSGTESRVEIDGKDPHCVAMDIHMKGGAPTTVEMHFMLRNRGPVVVRGRFIPDPASSDVLSSVLEAVQR